MAEQFHVFSSDLVANHHPFPRLLESPLRSRAIKSALEVAGYRFAEAARSASIADLYAVHDKKYIDLILAMGQMGAIRSTYHSLIDPRLQYYCRVSNGTTDAVLSSCGLVLQALEDISAGRLYRAFCIVRPPGHHAGIARGEGFCLVNNIAVAARKAVDAGMRVAIVDFDRHHGNGTQEIVRTFGENILFVSSYQEGCRYAKKYQEGLQGNSLLLSIPGNSSDDKLIERYASIVVPALSRHAPDILFISAGFDMWV